MCRRFDLGADPWAGVRATLLEQWTCKLLGRAQIFALIKRAISAVGIAQAPFGRNAASTSRHMCAQHLDTRPTSATRAQNRTMLDRFRTFLRRGWPLSTRFGSGSTNLAQSRPNSTNGICQSWPGLDCVWPDFDQNWPGIGQLWPDFGRIRAEFDQRGPKLPKVGQIWALGRPSSARARPSLALFPPNRDHVLLDHAPDPSLLGVGRWERALRLDHDACCDAAFLEHHSPLH